MKCYKILEHTADLKIQARGKDMAELFSCILKGMFESCRPVVKNESIINRRIKLSSSDLESLLVDFLSEALYLSDVNNEIYFNADLAIKQKNKKKQLKGEIKGKKIERLGLEIKAVTWHDLEVKKVNNQWQATVLFDT